MEASVKIDHLTKSSRFIETNKTVVLDTTSSSILTTEYESDDSYAHIFSQSIKLIQGRVINFKYCKLVDQVSNTSFQNICKFKVISLSNRTEKSKYVFLIESSRDLDPLVENEESKHRNELCILSDDEKNKLENNDQLLSINGIYFDPFSFNNAYNLLSTYFSEYNTHIESNYSTNSLCNNDLKLEQILSETRPIQLLISRNINSQIIQKYNYFSKADTISTRSASLLPFYHQNNDYLFYARKQMKIREKTMVLNTEWTQLETIELLNETNSCYLTSTAPVKSTNGTSNNSISGISVSSSSNHSGSGGGFGFGITGNKSTGVVVKAINFGGSAYKDGRLKINDQIFQIGETNVRSMSSEQVASVLRQPSIQGQIISFIVARPVHNNVTDIDLINMQEDTDSENFKTMLNKLNSTTADHPDSKCFIIRTTEIMDKNLNIQEKIKSELEKRIRAAKMTLNESNLIKNSDLMSSHEDNPNIDVISDIVDNNFSLKEINHTKNEEFDYDATSGLEKDNIKLPVKTSTPIRNISSKMVATSVSQNTALVESIIEIEQKEQNSKPSVTKVDHDRSNEVNDKTIVQEDDPNDLHPITIASKLSIDPIDHTANNNDELTNEEAKKNLPTIFFDYQIVNLSNTVISNDRSNISECHKKIEEILKKKTLKPENLLPIEIQAINLEACNQFLAKTYSILIGYEELNLPNYMQSGVSYKKTESFFYVKEKLIENVTIGLEAYDQIVEINSKPVEEFLSTADFMSDDLQSKLSMKLVKNLDLKIYKLKSKWKHLLEINNYLYDDLYNQDFVEEDDFEVIVVQVDKTKTKSLGISLEGTVDIDDNGVETSPHHYIRSIMSNGPVDKAIPCKLEPGDELLEIDSKKLYAINYLDLLNILKALGNKSVTIVCARRKMRNYSAVEQTSDKKFSKRAKSEGHFKPMQETSFLASSSVYANQDFYKETTTSDETRKRAITEGTNVEGIEFVRETVSMTKSTPSLSENAKNNNEQKRQSRLSEHQTAKTPMDLAQSSNPMCIPRSRSLEQTCLAMWHEKVTYINLVKSNKGLGFSLIDYQHNQFTPMSKTLVVIRALVPSGVAQIDGRLLPGQRLVSINNVSLDDDVRIRIDPYINENRVSEVTKGLDKNIDLLKYTVAILKSLPCNTTVRLGVQKPLPYPEAVVPTSKRAKSQNIDRKIQHNQHRAKSPIYSTKANIGMTDKTESRKKKKKNLKRRKKIISTSQYDLKSEDESESVVVDSNDIDMKLNKNSELLKSFNKMNLRNEALMSRSEYDETTDNVLKGSSSLSLSSSEEKIKEKNKNKNNDNIQTANETELDCNLTSAYEDDKEDKIIYGLMATSAPAILNDLETLEKQRLNQKGHSFYSTSSLVKAMSRNYLSNIKAKSDFDMKNLNFNKSDENLLRIHQSDIEENEENRVKFLNTFTSQQPRMSAVKITKGNLTSGMLAILKDSSIALTVSNVDLNCETTTGNQIDKQFVPKTVNAETLLNRIIQGERDLNGQDMSAEIELESLLSDELNIIINKKKNMPDMKFIDDDSILMDKLITKNNKQLITEEQFETAFLINANKKLLSLDEIILSRDDLSNENMNQESENETTKSKSRNSANKSHHKSAKNSSRYLIENEFDNNDDLIKIRPHHAKDKKTSEIKKRSNSAKNVRTTSSNTKESSKKSHKRSRSPSNVDSKSLHGDMIDVKPIGFTLSRTVPSSISNMVSRVPSRCNSLVKVLNVLGTDLVKFPAQLEKEVKIKKNFDPLGIINVDCFIDHGINGCAILKIEPNSACAKDKTLDCGDYLVSVNNEKMRNSTNSRAKSILNRASLTSTDVLIRYISLDDAIAYVEDLNRTYGYSFPVNNKCYQTYKREVTLAKEESKSISSNLEDSSLSASSLSISITNSLDSLPEPNSPSKPHQRLYTDNSCDHAKNTENELQELHSMRPTNKQEAYIINDNCSSKKGSSKTNISNLTTASVKESNISVVPQKQTSSSETENFRSQIEKDIKSPEKTKIKKPHTADYDSDIDDYGDNILNESLNKNFVLTPSASIEYERKKSDKTLDVSLLTLMETIESAPDELVSTIWGPPRKVILNREQNKSLGISIVGGKLDISTKNSSDTASKTATAGEKSSFISGIFIKHVLENSPAGLNGTLHTGDRILAVDGHDLTNATHNKAVEIIRNSKENVEFLIQSLLINEDATDSNQSPELSSLKEEEGKTADEGKDEVSVVKIDKTPQFPDNVYNYSIPKLEEKYSNLLNKSVDNKEILIVRLERSSKNESLGLSLSGNNDLNKASVFVCDIYPGSPAFKIGQFKLGDQLLEINGKVIYGRAHSNVTPIVRSINDLVVYMIILRSVDSLNEMYKQPKSSSSDFRKTDEPFSEATSPKRSQPTNVNPLEEFSKTASQKSDEKIEITDQKLDNKKVSFKSSESRTFSDSSDTGNATNQTFNVVLRKNKAGFGIAISEDRHHRLIVRGLNPNGVAHRDGRIQIGDEILQVNSIDVKVMNYDDIMGMLHTTQEPVEFKLRRSSQITKNAEDSSLATETAQLILTNKTSFPNFKLSSEINTKKNLNCLAEKPPILNDNPRTDPIRLCQETWIEIERGKQGLGLSIVGGYDTQLQGIVIHDIYQNGAAMADKRLAIGDQILKVNDIDLMTATHDQALNALRQTSNIVRLLIYRGFLHSDHSDTDQEGIGKIGSKGYFKKSSEDLQHLNVLNIELVKKFAKGLGFSIIGSRHGTGVFISHIIEGGCAQKDGRLMIGDLLLEVNGSDIRKSNYNDIAFLLKTLPQGKVNLKIGRYRTSASQSQTNSLNNSSKTSRRNSVNNKQQEQ